MTELNQGEVPRQISYPIDGVRAIEVPLENLRVDTRNGIIKSKVEGSDFVESLTGETSSTGQMQQVRSAVVFHDHDAIISDFPDSAEGHQAGFTVIQGREGVRQFDLDLSLDSVVAGDEITPKTAHVQIFLFNTPYPQVDVSSTKVRATKQNEASIDSTEWQTVMLQPGFPYSQERIKWENTGDNDLEFRVRTVDAGKAYSESLDAQGTTVKTLNPGDTGSFYSETAAEFIVLEAREATAGQNSTLEAVFTGEA